MKKNLLVCLFTLFVFQLHAADYYWVGGGGNWSDINNWRLNSPAGNVPSIVPSAGDNVFFGAYSNFGTTAATRTVTLNTNAFCNNMTWEAGVANNPLLARGGSSNLYISGSLVLQPTMGYTGNVNVEFTGAAPATLTTNGSFTGIFNININKPGGVLTLTDDLIYTGSTTNNNFGLTLTAGTLDASGRTMELYSFWSENNNVRHLNITGGRLSVMRNFYFRGTNKTTAAEGSYVYANIRLVTDGGEFDEVEASSNSPNNDLFSVYNTTFRKLVFSHTSLASNARIHAGNTVDSLIFMGQGVVREGSNTIRYLSIAGDGTVGGTNNVIQYAEIGGGFYTINSGGHVFDTLLTAPNKEISITGGITINKRFRAGGEPCDGFTEISGSSGGTIHFADGAEIEIDNVLLSNIAATGSMTPLTVNGIDNEGNSGFIFNTPPASTRTLYWVGGSGDWNDRNHWSESSGGIGGACIPFIGDDVVFDGNSGLNAGGTVATSGNTYCRDMTWAATITGSPTFTTDNNFYMQVYGSVVLNPNVTMNAQLDMRGTEAVTFTTNGNVKGNNRILIRKEADDALAGGVTLLDNWLNPAGSIQLNRGHLDVVGRTVNIDIFTSNVNNSGRHVDMQNADVAVNRWEYRSNAKTLDAANSHLSVREWIYTTGNLVQYDAVDVSSGSLREDYFLIDGTGFRELIFSNPSLTTVARIGSNNVIERLEFKGQGSVAGTGNAIDSLITGENRNFWFAQGSNTISEYFKATHPDCSGLGEIRSFGTNSTIVFGANAEVEMANVYMENITASGGGGTLTLPITFSGADAGGNTGWNIVASDGDARYWVGGAGDWNDASHWSTVSGGPGGACIPTVGNDVYFDANSGFGTAAAARTITVNNGNAYFRNMDWTGAINNPILNRNSAWNMEAWGESIVLNPAVTLNAAFQLRGAAATVMTGRTLGNFDLELRKPGGSFTIAENYTNTETDIMLYEGDFSASGIELSVRSIDNENRDTDLSVDISGSTLTFRSHWRYSGTTTNRSLNAMDAVINTYQFIAQGFAYHQVNVSGSGNSDARLSEITANKLTFTQTNVISSIGINGANNQLDTVEYKGGGGIYGTNNTIGTLIFFPGSRYTIAAGTNTTVTGDWFGSGTPCQLTEIVSSSPSAVAMVTKTAGTVDFDYVRLQRITATGGAEFSAGSHSLDLGGSSGWDIAPYDGASPIEGLGPDVRLSDAEFPYTISTAGFFGSPLSQYEWMKDGLVIGTGSELVVTEPGEYSIKVDFPDGCTVFDAILISDKTADLVTVKALKDDTQTSYIPGEEVVYTITITNNGLDEALDVTVVDEAPDGTEITNWTASVIEGDVDLPNASGTGNLSETISILPNGAVVEYEVTLATASSRTEDLTNTVTVTSITLDPEPDCAACVTTPIPATPEASVSIAKVLDTETQVSYVPGDDVVYIITVTNDGPSDAREVVIVDTAPAGTSIASWTAAVTTGTATLPNTSGTGDLNETIAVLPSDAVVTYTITIQTPAEFTDDLINTATVSSDTEDPDNADNSSTTVGLPSIPAAPISDGDQEECADDPLQTLTATATVPDGVTIVWYDAASDGNEVANPILDEVGSVTYYAEAHKGTLVSLTRTAVTLTINELPNLVVTDPPVTCATETIDLTAAAIIAGSDVGLIYTYYTDAAGTVTLADPDAVSSSGTYYIRGTNPTTGCSTMSPVTVQFVDRPVVTVVHPDCVVETGSITISNPLGAGFEYSINGVDYQPDPVFENVEPGTYSVTAQHVSVPGCVSEPREVIINASATTYTPTVIQPDCDSPLGQVILPDDLDYEYAVYQEGETPVYQSDPVFTGLEPGEYLVQMRSLIVSCEADPITVTIDDAPIVPAAPISGGDLELCAETPLQTLTATATVSAGETITWYDEAVGGNVVANPILNTVGTVTYYAEASNGDCVSATRTPVTLTIYPLPVIDALDDQVACGVFVLPDFTGTNLTGDKAYYTAPGGAGTRYEIGAEISTPGTYTLYQYATTDQDCAAEVAFELIVNETPTAGAIENDQDICYGDIPAALGSVTAGTGTGTIAYRWEQSDDDGASWMPIADAMDATYQPEGLTVTTQFRRITIATANGITCESEPTNPVVVTVAEQLFADAGVDQSHVNDGAFTLNATVPALGTGQWSVVAGTPAVALSDVDDPEATITLEPGTSVTLRWTVVNGDCEVYDEVTLTHLIRSFGSVKTVVDGNGNGLAQSKEALTYTITVTNTGDVDLVGVEITDAIPVGTTYITGSANTTGGNFAGDEVTWTIDVPVGAAVNARFAVLVVEDVTGLENITNTATVSYPTDPSIDDQEPNVGIVVGVDRSFTSVKAVLDEDEDGVARPEEELTYSITVENTGDIDLEGIVISDPIPAGTQYVDGSADADGGIFDPVSNRIEWNVDIPFGGSVTVTFVVAMETDLTAIDAIANTATISDPDNPLSIPQEASAPELPVEAARGFASRKLVIDENGDGLAQAGEELTYTVTVENTGNIALTDMVISDPIPTGTTYVSGSANLGGDYDEAGNALRWEIDVPVGDVVSVSFRVVVVENLTGMTAITNTAVVTDEGSDVGTPQQPTAPAVPIAATRSFASDKTVADENGDALAQAGESLTYTITITNTGDVDLEGIVINDEIPTGTTYEAGSADQGGTFDGDDNLVTWTVDVPFGETIQMRFQVRIDEDLTGLTEILNTALVTDPVDAVSQTPSAPVVPVDALSTWIATKSVEDANGDGLAQAGEELTYTIVVENTGDADLTGITIEDAIPNGTTYVSGSADQGGIYHAESNRVEWTVEIPFGQSVRVNFKVAISPDLTGLETIANTATVSDLLGASQTASSPDLPIDGNRNFTATKSVEDASGDGEAQAGEVLTYTIRVENRGDVDLTDVVIQDAIPEGTHYVVGSANQGGSYVTADNRVEWTVDIPVGGAQSVSFNVTVDDDVSAHTEVANTAVITDPANPSNPIQASSPTLSITPPVVINRTADLAVTKSVDDLTPLVGTDVVFTIEVTNDGPDDATGVIVADELPSGYAFKSSETSRGNYGDASGVWTIGDLADGATATLRITAQVNSAGDYRNVARVNGNEDDPNDENNEDEVQLIPAHSPEAIDDAVIGNSNTVMTIAVLANDGQNEHAHPLDATSVEIVSEPQHGTISINPDGTVIYTPTRGYVGTDQFTYRVRDVEGYWSNVATVSITIEANPLKIPSVFTPNGDGQNDQFEIVGIEGYDRVELVIFNRWGNEIYRHNNYNNTWGGDDIHEGTYYYLLTLHRGNSSQVEKGWVVLKRK